MEATLERRARDATRSDSRVGRVALAGGRERPVASDTGVLEDRINELLGTLDLTMIRNQGGQ